MKLPVSIFSLFLFLSIDVSSGIIWTDSPPHLRKKKCELVCFEAQDWESFPDLPREILETILSNASLKDIYNFCRTSKANYQIFELDNFWYFLSKRDFPKECTLLAQEPKNGWKEFYKNCLENRRRESRCEGDNAGRFRNFGILWQFAYGHSMLEYGSTFNFSQTRPNNTQTATLSWPINLECTCIW